MPHIKHTEALEAAAIAVTRAVNGCGCPVMLCRNPLDAHVVEESLREASSWFIDPNFFFIDCRDDPAREPGNTRLAAATNLILLTTLYREHIKAGNIP